MMPVERNGAIFLGIDHDGERGNAGLAGTINGINKKHAPEQAPELPDRLGRARIHVFPTYVCQEVA